MKEQEEKKGIFGKMIDGICALIERLVFQVIKMVCTMALILAFLGVIFNINISYNGKDALKRLDPVDKAIGVIKTAKKVAAVL